MSVKRPYRQTVFRSGLILVMVPTVLSLLFLLLFNQFWAHLTELTEQDNAHTDIVCFSNAAIHDLMILNTATVTYQWTKRPDSKRLMDQYSQSLMRHMEKVAELSKKADPEQAKFALEMHSLCSQAYDMKGIDAMAPGPSDDMITRAFKQGRQAAELAKRGFIMSGKVRQEMDRQQMLLDDIRTRRRAGEARIQLLVYGGFLGSMLVALGMVLAFNQQFRGRLNALMQEARNLARTKSAGAVLPGDDELAFLSRSLAEVKARILAAAAGRQAIIQMVAHDVRSPLMAAGLSLDLVVKTAADRLGPAAIDVLKTTNAALRSTVSFVNGLLQSDAEGGDDRAGAPNATPGQMRRPMLAKVMAIVFIPLILQVAWLVYLQKQINATVKLSEQEHYQASLITTCGQVIIAGLEATSAVGLYTVTNKIQLKQLAGEDLDRANNFMTVLTKLVGGDPSQAEQLSMLRQMLASATDYFRSFELGKLKDDLPNQLAKLDKFRKEIARGGNAMTKSIDALEKERLLLDNQREEQRSAMRAIQKAVYAGACVNLLVAFGLLFAFSRNINQRMNALIDNVSIIRANRGDTASVGGSDELYQLNAVLLDAAAELKSAAAERARLLHELVQEMQQPLKDAQVKLDDVRNNPQLDRVDQERLQDAKDSVAFVMNLIDELADVEAIENGNLSLQKDHCSLSEVVEESVASVKSLAADKSIEVVARNENLNVLIDKRRFLQVLNNVLSNAVKFSPVSSTITIETNRIEDGIAVTVDDQGPGIPAEFRERIFDRFVQVPEAGSKGFGLGLAIARSIVESHGGTINCQVREQGGARFSIILPKSAADDAVV